MPKKKTLPAQVPTVVTTEEVQNSADKVKFTDVITTHFLGYAIRIMSDRALPSGCDGLKPVQRRILWTMYESKTFPTTAFRKCARIIGDTLGKYHPHADGSVYGALVNMTSNYAMYPLIESQGNFGIRGEDPPAAIRYTESRLHKNALDLALVDLDEKCVDFRSNYDQTLEEPTALPVKVPLLLLNGTLGIAVSVASFVPSHNLAEVIKMCIAALENDKEKAYQHFHGPDWMSEGEIYFSESERRRVFESGRGSVKIYAKLECVPPTGRKKYGQIKIWSIPWTTHRQKILEQIVSLQSEIPDLRIEKSLKPGEPKITLETAEDLERVKKLLLKKTLLATSYSYNMVYLDGKLPVQGGIYDVICQWLQFRKKTLRSRFQLQLSKLEDELKFLDAKMKLTDKVFNEFTQKLRKASRKETLRFLVQTLPTDLNIAERILASRISIFSRDSDADFFQKHEQLTTEATRLKLLLTDDEALKTFIENELKALQKLSPKRNLKLLAEEPKVVEAAVNLETRQFQITPDLCIIPGSGERYSTGASFVVITKTGAARLQLRNFRKYRDGAKIALETLPEFEDTPLYISKADELLLITFADGTAQVLNTAKVRTSNAFRSFRNTSEILQIQPVEQDDSRLMVTVNQKFQLNVNRFSELYQMTSRVLTKLRLSSHPVLLSQLCAENAQLCYKVANSRKVHKLPLIEQCHEKRSLKMSAIDATKQVTSVEIHVPENSAES